MGELKSPFKRSALQEGLHKAWEVFCADAPKCEDSLEFLVTASSLLNPLIEPEENGD